MTEELSQDQTGAEDENTKKEKEVDIYFKAPWGDGLKYMMMIGSGLVVLVSIFINPREMNVISTLLFLLIPITLLSISAFLIVTKYQITKEELILHGFFWKIAYPLNELESAKHNPKATDNSSRIFGGEGSLRKKIFINSNSEKLGDFDNFVTDRETSTLLRFKNCIVVISPEDPSSFVQTIRVVSGLADKND